MYVNTGSCCQPYNITPIVIDVDGSGFKLTSAHNGVWFDFFATSSKRKISWTEIGTDDSFLVLDRNGNGQIDNGRELFGNLTPQPGAPNANGFLALAEFDKPGNGGNSDGMIDSHDAIFSQLRLWQDANHNGLSEAGELLTLPSKQIHSLSLDFKEARRRDRFGNVFRYRAFVNGAQRPGRWAYDVFLVESP